MTSNYAVGHAQGGSLFGATINNTYTNSTAGAPDAFTQIANYTSSLSAHADGSAASNVSNTLHFLWIGSNDISLKHIYVWGGLEWINARFVARMAAQMAELVQNLIDAGAEYVFVPNLYARDISPAISFMATDNGVVDAAYVAELAGAIAAANVAIEAALVQFGSKAIYYDVNSFMHKIMAEKQTYGITHAGLSDGLYEFCDGYSDEDWDLCMEKGQGEFCLDMAVICLSLILCRRHVLLAAVFGHDDVRPQVDCSGYGQCDRGALFRIVKAEQGGETHTVISDDRTRRPGLVENRSSSLENDQAILTLGLW
jgi:hypothetical protein